MAWGPPASLAARAEQSKSMHTSMPLSLLKSVARTATLPRPAASPLRHVTAAHVPAARLSTRHLPAGETPSPAFSCKPLAAASSCHHPGRPRMCGRGPSPTPHYGLTTGGPSPPAPFGTSPSTDRCWSLRAGCPYLQRHVRRRQHISMMPPLAPEEPMPCNAAQRTCTQQRVKVHLPPRAPPPPPCSPFSPVPMAPTKSAMMVSMPMHMPPNAAAVGM
jgi:hypothetical protein